MIDIHMMQLEGANPEWRAKAMASIGRDADVHIVEGVLGFSEYQRRRMEAMLIGDNPYSTYVDEDDWLQPDALNRMRSVMSATANRFGYVSLERVWDYFNKTTYVLRKHHMLVVHKDHVKRMLDLPVLPPNPERALAMHKAIIPVDAILYNWRRYPSVAFHNRLEQGEEPEAKGRIDVDLTTPLNKFVHREYRGRVDPAI